MTRCDLPPLSRVQLEHNKSLSLSHARIAQRERLKGDMDAEKRMVGVLSIS